MKRSRVTSVRDAIAIPIASAIQYSGLPSEADESAASNGRGMARVLDDARDDAAGRRCPSAIGAAIAR